MERHKTVQQMKFGAEDPMRFRFCRVSRHVIARHGSGDVRLTRRNRDKYKTARIDVRIKDKVAKACGLQIGDFIEMTAGSAGDDIFIRLTKTPPGAEGMMLCRNKQASSNDLRVTFTTTHSEADRFFGEKKVFVCTHESQYDDNVFFITGAE